MAMSNMQKMFNLAYRGIARQGFYRSVSTTGHCRYRGPDGMKCAVGHLVPDNAIPEDRDLDLSYNLEDIMDEGMIRHFDNTPEHCRFVEELQEAHDSSTNPDLMKGNLQQFAEKWRLAIPDIGED